MSTHLKPDPLVGTVIADRYRVVRPIARGGMGVLYEVVHTRLNRTFALKTLSAELAGDREAMARFRREADVVVSLNHPNVVQVVDWETLDDGSPCMVMEYLHGHDLASEIAAGPLPWAKLAQIADQVMSALAVAHRAGIVHRDLKPQNVFLARDDAGGERAKLLDFGISKSRLGPTFATGDDRLLGTPAYMSPEQADGQSSKITASTDVWAMGALLYEMAGGQVAFGGASAPSILYRICHGAPDPLQPLRPDAPAAFTALIDRALNRDPAQRIVDIDALRRGLRAALGPLTPNAFGEPIDPAPPSSPGVAPAMSTTLSRANGEKSLLRPAARRRAIAWVLPPLVAAAVGGWLWLRPAAHAPISIAPAAPPMQVTPLPVPAKIAPPAPRAFTITVKIHPTDARLDLDGAPVEGPIVEVPADRAPHVLTARAPGRIARSVTVSAAGPRSLAIDLPRAPRKASHHAQPPAPDRPQPLEP